MARRRAGVRDAPSTAGAKSTPKRGAARVGKVRRREQPLAGSERRRSSGPGGGAPKKRRGVIARSTGAVAARPPSPSRSSYSERSGSPDPSLCVLVRNAPLPLLAALARPYNRSALPCPNTGLRSLRSFFSLPFSPLPSILRPFNNSHQLCLPIQQK